ncbi:MAG: roadblock/LC7 domain-containing protein [Kineosporiaceae bacterium]|nr:roadblock/LC7 domain-containing protein [Kineosporiaceae bacterium]MBK7621909.1 roadblock/LC7 domain-containing protein [Kineosporiaceae bacterium]MBK8074223.1 roadblock/LC7 domain-containing protein [Kineosporiaceae bacterium]
MTEPGHALPGDVPVRGKGELLDLLLQDVRHAVPELNGVMIASLDGLPVAHDFAETDADRVAAMAATALGLGTRISQRISLGDFQEAVVRGDSGYLVAYSAGRQAVLVMCGPSDANLALMRIEARAVSVKINQLLT